MDSTAVSQYISIAISATLAIGVAAYRIVHNRINKLSDKHDKLKEKVLTDFVQKEDYQRDIDEMKESQKQTHRDVTEVKEMMLRHWGGDVR